MRANGTRIGRIVGSALQLSDEGADVLPDLQAVEIEYLVREPWVVTAEDLLWRGSKPGLHLGPEAPAVLAMWLHARCRQTGGSLETRVAAVAGGVPLLFPGLSRVGPGFGERFRINERAVDSAQPPAESSEQER